MSKILKIFFAIVIISWLCDAFGIQPIYAVAGIVFFALTTKGKKED